ncbi:EamA family transporter RarD [Pseudoxanthomonas suwonensis]|uniref:EamA family transporter RarD n=1 Tax=Pseudoxanthomonas suwonensis TaxID=314722 RepID=UPI00138F17A5|nr:EamA family transporter RarD [Pseudoxanthomonas suwonensis]KAF1701432.1 protein RarD [Pseudoxanthomonas suwonensis]
MSATPASTAIDRRGLAVTAGTFVLWGVVPVYWHLLKHVPAMQIMAHRVVWSALLVVAWLLLSNGFGWLRKLAAQPRALPALALSAVLIAFNWGLYIWAVNAGHVVETSLGYFINPLVNVVLGVLVLHERLRRMQWIAVGCAALGVAWLTVQAGSPPWIALGLAASFGLYGLVRKLVAVDPVAGLGLESLYLFLPSLAYVLWAEAGHGGSFASGWGWGTDLLLVFGGVVTAVPLIGFAYGVRRIPLSMVGLLQYIAPTLQLLLGVWFFHEPFGAGRAVGFGAIWLGLALYAGEGLWRSRGRLAR